MKLARNKKGIIDMPTEYLFVIIIASISIALILYTGYKTKSEMEYRMALQQANDIVKQAEEMSIHGFKEQSIVNVSIPSSTKKIIFGSQEENASNKYEIIMKNGKRGTFYSNYARFIGKNDGAAVIYGGSYKIILKLIYKDGEKYVQISYEK